MVLNYLRCKKVDFDFAKMTYLDYILMVEDVQFYQISSLLEVLLVIFSELTSGNVSLHWGSTFPATTLFRLLNIVNSRSMSHFNENPYKALSILSTEKATLRKLLKYNTNITSATMIDDNDFGLHFVPEWKTHYPNLFVDFSGLPSQMESLRWTCESFGQYIFDGDWAPWITWLNEIKKILNSYRNLKECHVTLQFKYEHNFYPQVHPNDSLNKLKINFEKAISRFEQKLKDHKFLYKRTPSTYSQTSSNVNAPQRVVWYEYIWFSSLIDDNVLLPTLQI
jgi:hypothetical protein